MRKEHINKNESKNEEFKRLFLAICEIKVVVINSKGKDLANFKMIFYNQNFPKERLDMLWSFIWGDIDFEMLTQIFKNTKLI